MGDDGDIDVVQGRDALQSFLSLGVQTRLLDFYRQMSSQCLQGKQVVMIESACICALRIKDTNHPLFPHDGHGQLGAHHSALHMIVTLISRHIVDQQRLAIGCHPTGDALPADLQAQVFWKSLAAAAGRGAQHKLAGGWVDQQ